MRLLICFLIFFLSQNSFAKFDFKCATNPKTTNFTFEQQGEEMVLTTLHVNGVDYMPVHEGIIVPSDLPYLKSVSTTLKHMGMKNEFRFPVSKCKSYGPGIITCSGGERKTLDGVTMQALSLITKKITTQVFDMKVDSIKVTLDVNIEGFSPVQEITMEYAPEACEFSL